MRCRFSDAEPARTRAGGHGLKSMASVEQLGLAGLGARGSLSAVASRAAAYLSLTKPRLVLLVLVTVAAGFFLGARGSLIRSTIVTLAATLLGTALVAGGAGALNQWLERERDAPHEANGQPGVAQRAHRPARSRSSSARCSCSAGTGILLLGASLLAAAVAFLTFVLYVFVYTPLKTRTTLNTLVGAIPGALPPLIGWAAAAGRLGPEAWSLFLIVFLWQFPALPGDRLDLSRRLPPRRFSDADRAGRAGKEDGPPGRFRMRLCWFRRASCRRSIGLAGPVYSVGALLLGLVYLADAARFWLDVDRPRARRLLYSSFLVPAGDLDLAAVESDALLTGRPVAARSFLVLDRRVVITMASETHSSSAPGPSALRRPCRRVPAHHAPVSPGKVAMWLFLATEVMFFTGLIGSYIVLRAGSPHNGYTQPLPADDLARRSRKHARHPAQVGRREPRSTSSTSCMPRPA